MSETPQPNFDSVSSVIRDPLHFKYKLDIGEDAFESLRLKKYLLDAVDAGNGALVGFGAAKSSLVASTFFAPSGLLGAIGVGTASTPLGWALAAGVVGAGLSLVVGKHFIRGTSSKVRTIPDYISTPMDVLAVGLFDLMALLGVKVALVDGEFDKRERGRIRRYFIEDWGYDEAFVDAGLKEIELAATDYTISEIAEQLAAFKKQNPDCNYETMSRELVIFLHELSAADGVIDGREVLAIEKVEGVFAEVNRLKLGAVVAGTLDAASEAGRRTADTVGGALSKATELTRQQLSRVKSKAPEDDA